MRAWDMMSGWRGVGGGGGQKRSWHVTLRTQHQHVHGHNQRHCEPHHGGIGELKMRMGNDDDYVDDGFGWGGGGGTRLLHSFPFLDGQAWVYD